MASTMDSGVNVYGVRRQGAQIHQDHRVARCKGWHRQQKHTLAVLASDRLSSIGGLVGSKINMWTLFQYKWIVLFKGIAAYMSGDI